MDFESQNGGAKPKLMLNSASKSNKSNKPNKTSTPKLQISKKNKGKSEGKSNEHSKGKSERKSNTIAQEIGKVVGQEILPEGKGKGSKVLKKKQNKSKQKSDKKSKQKSDKKSKQKSDKKEIIDLKEPDVNSREFDYQQIILNYDVNNNKSINVLTQYEISIIIGKRASQISMGALPMIKVTSNMNHIDIAEEELRQKKTPYIIKRDIGSRSEYWKIEDLELSDAI